MVAHGVCPSIEEQRLVLDSISLELPISMQEVAHDYAKWSSLKCGFCSDGEFEMSRKRRKPEWNVAELRRLVRRRLSAWLRHPQQDPAQETHYRSGQSRDPEHARKKPNLTLAASLRIVSASVVRPKPVRSKPLPRQKETMSRGLRRAGARLGAKRSYFRTEGTGYETWLDFSIATGRYIVLLVITWGSLACAANVGRMKLWKGSCDGAAVDSSRRRCPHIDQMFRP